MPSLLVRTLIVLVAALAGGWMIFDGLHVLVRGKYFGPERPGPWSVPFARAGINPLALGPVFIALGVCWLVFLAAMLGGRTWGRYGAAAVAIASLWYFPLGTMLAAIYLGLLWLNS
jgi:hypothetical protein